jgi:hypothetical protein
MPLIGYELQLYCSPMQHGAVKIKIQYPHFSSSRLDTKGTLHLTQREFIALVRMLRLGGGDITLTGPYLAKHPQFHRLGTSHDEHET